MSTVTVDIRGLAATQKLLATVDDKERFNRERRAVRAAGNIFKPALVASARAHHGGSENVPASFAKVRIKVSSSNRRGRMPTAIIRPTSPLFNIFEPGASPHDIAPKAGLMGGPAGSGGWSKEGRKRPGAFAARGTVHHPGMSSRALLPGVFAANVSQAEDAAAAIIFGRPGVALGSIE
jgi:hypothetical protein